MVALRLSVPLAIGSGNFASNDGGGIHSNEEVILRNSSVSGNAALAGRGGGIYNLSLVRERVADLEQTIENLQALVSIDESDVEAFEDRLKRRRRPFEAAGQEAPLMDRDEEMRLAMSAGPPAVSEDASIYVLGGAGFERVRDGDNGWACLVARSANDPQVLAPHCLNPHAVASVLPAMLAEARLQRRGLSSSEIDEELGSRWRSGEIPMPTGPAYAYMLSKGQHLGQAAGQFQPHFMLYLPNATNESVGGDRTKPQFGFVGPRENHPLSTLVILMDEFVDPDELPVGRR